MTAFGIITTKLGGDTEHYVGEVAALWDWLQADNFELTAGGNLFRLQAPVGYVFYHDNLLPVEDSAGYDGGGRDSEFVSLGSGKESKALMLLISLRFVSPEEFTEMGIDAERIMEIETY
jgi:hypothetical protein